MDTTHLQAIQDASLKIKEGEVKIKMTKGRHSDKLPNVLKDQYANDNPFRVCCCPRNPSRVTGRWNEFVGQQIQLLNPVLGGELSTGTFEMVGYIGDESSESEKEQSGEQLSGLAPVNVNLNRRKSISVDNLKDREKSWNILKRVFVTLFLPGMG